MRLLLDTQIAFWLMYGPDRLTVGESAIIAAERDRTAVSVISLWELRVKWQRRYTSGNRKGPADPALLLEVLRDAQFRLIDLAPAVCVADLDPPLDHSDPFDQLLLAQAQQGGYRLLTRDEKMKAHPVALHA